MTYYVFTFEDNNSVIVYTVINKLCSLAQFIHPSPSHEFMQVWAGKEGEGNEGRLGRGGD